MDGVHSSIRGHCHHDHGLWPDREIKQWYLCVHHICTSNGNGESGHVKKDTLTAQELLYHRTADNGLYYQRVGLYSTFYHNLRARALMATITVVVSMICLYSKVCVYSASATLDTIKPPTVDVCSVTPHRFVDIPDLMQLPVILPASI